MINELKIWEGMTSDIETVLQIAKSPDNWFCEDGIKYIEQDLEPQQRAHSPWVLPFGSASHAAGLASESKLDRIPYGRRFPAACGGELQFTWWDIQEMVFPL